MFNNQANVTKTHMKKWIIWCINIILLFGLALFIFLSDQKPGQFDSEINKTVQAIQPADLTLVVFTDLHHDPDKDEPHPMDHMMDCIRTVMERTKADALWNLGDLINGHGTKQLAVKQIHAVINCQKKVTTNYHNIQGNHDDNIQATYGEKGLPETEVLTNEELNKILENRNSTQTENHSSLRSTDYYVDFPTIRVVCITAENTAWTEETAVWLRTVALDTKKEVLVLSHIPTRPEWGFKNDVKNGELVEDALREFATHGGTIIAYIHGHDHGDMIRDAGEWKEIAIGCARFQKPTSNGTEGMVFWDRDKNNETELLFDVVCIDQKKREVRFIRFGAGDDRTIEY